MDHLLLGRESKVRGKSILLVATMFCLFVFFLGVPGIVLAQEKYPTKSVNFLVGFAAGGTTDVSARALAKVASNILGEPIVIVNKPGAASAMQMTILKNEKPDGYTIGALLTGAITAQYLQKTQYDSAKDFTPIIQVGENCYGLVVQHDSPWKTFREFIDYAKANPGRIRYSSAGVGNPSHLVSERLAMKEKIKWTHIPYEGGAPSVAALLGAHVEAASTDSIWRKYVEAGRLRLLAVYGEKRMSNFPDVPTLLELGYNITASTINCIVGPKGLSPQIVKTLHGAFKKALEDPDVIQVIDRMDMVIRYRSPEELAKHLVELNEETGSVIRVLGLAKE